MNIIAAEDCFVLSRMPEYAEEYNALLSWLDMHTDELIGENDSFLADKAYPAFLLANPLEPGKNIDVKLLRWEIPTEKNKLVSIFPDKDSFRFLGMFVPDDETKKSASIIDVDAVRNVTDDIPNARFTFIIADQYHTTFVQVESDHGAYLIPYSLDEQTLGLKSGVLQDHEEALSVIDKNMSYIRDGTYAYNENGEPLAGGGGGNGASSAGNSFPAPVYLILGMGAIVCIVAPFAVAKRKAKKE
jgi:hypothetical protein